MTKQTHARGYFVYAKHVVVTCLLDKVDDLELAGFSHQNVVFGIDVEFKDGKFRLVTSPPYGPAGFITAGKLSFLLFPARLPTIRRNELRGP
jgi:hypothetical protein